MAPCTYVSAQVNELLSVTEGREDLPCTPANDYLAAVFIRARTEEEERGQDNKQIESDTLRNSGMSLE